MQSKESFFIRHNRVKGFIFDMEGTLTNGGKLIPGVTDLINFLREQDYKIRFLTNMTGRMPAQLAAELRALGLKIYSHEIRTSVTTAIEYLQTDKVGKKGFFAIPQNIRVEFIGFQQDEVSPDYVLIGDLEAEFTYELLNQILQYLDQGAELIAFHKNRYFMRNQKRHLDSGIYVESFEAILGIKATITGKPSPTIFTQAIDSMSLTAEEVIIIGDDLLTDIAGAKRLNIPAILVGTGKFDRSKQEIPESVNLYLDSASELISLLAKP